MEGVHLGDIHKVNVEKMLQVSEKQLLLFFVGITLRKLLQFYILRKFQPSSSKALNPQVTV